MIVNLPLLIRKSLFTTGSARIKGLGTFILEKHSAQIDKVNNRITPPNSEIVFKEVDLNSNSFINFISLNTGVDKQKSETLLGEYVSKIKAEIKTRGNATISELGILKKDDDKIAFEPFTSSNFINKLYDDVKLPSEQKTVITTESKPGSLIPSKSISHTRKKKKFTVLTYSLVITAGLAALIYFTGIHKTAIALFNSEKPQNSINDNSNTMVFGNPPAWKDSLQEAVSKKLDEITTRESALSYKPSQEEDILREDINNNEPVPQPLNNDTLLPYHIIAGSFLVSGNADRQKSQLENMGFSPQIVKPSDSKFYMVSLGSYFTLQKATEVMDSLRNTTDIQLWVTRL